MSTTTVPAVTRFHLSLNVSDLSRSVDFFQRVLGVPPAKRRNDYAKFEPDSPPLVLSLEPRATSSGGPLNHAGFRFPDVQSLVAAQRRLEEGGLRTKREEGVECCYARQTKFWAHDPDGTLWEFYVLEGDIDHRGAGQSQEAMGITPQQIAARTTVWEHRLGQPLQIPAEFDGESLEEIRLRGTFNVPVGTDEMLRILKQSFATLKPSGELLVHVLTAEAPLSTPPQLPGGASIVSYVPVREDVLSAVEASGFIDLQLKTFRSKACFEQEGIPLRETIVTARRPPAAAEALCTVVFKGPFAEATDDTGHTWYRGRRMAIPLSRWQALQKGPLAELFVELPAETVVGACGRA